MPTTTTSIDENGHWLRKNITFIEPFQSPPKSCCIVHSFKTSQTLNFAYIFCFVLKKKGFILVSKWYCWALLLFSLERKSNALFWS